MLACVARASGPNRIDPVALSQNGKNMFAVECGSHDPSHTRIVADTAQAAARPVAQAGRAIEQDAAAKKAAPEPSPQAAVASQARAIQRAASVLRPARRERHRDRHRDRHQ